MLGEETESRDKSEVPESGFRTWLAGALSRLDFWGTGCWERSMRWDELPQSENVEDRRGEEGGYGGGGSGFPIGTGGMGIGTLVVLGLVGWALGIDPRLLIGGAEILGGGGHSYHTPYRAPAQTGAPS